MGQNYYYVIDCNYIQVQFIQIWMDSKENISKLYGDDKIHEMTEKQYRFRKQTGAFQTIEQIFLKLPRSRMQKDNYSFIFDNIKNNIETQIEYKSKLNEILKRQKEKAAAIDIKKLPGLEFIPEKEDQLYKEKLQSGLPIFKSILYLRFQDNQKYQEVLGEENAFIEDQRIIQFSKIKNDINNLKMFIGEENILPMVLLQNKDKNTVNIKNSRYPQKATIHRRAQALAKLFLLKLFKDEHRKLKQSWKNDENYKDLQKMQKKLKSESNQEKIKDEDIIDDSMLKQQVNKITSRLEEKANIIAHDQFRKQNGERAIQIKKSLEKLINSLKSQKNPKNQLKILIAYKQKKAW